MSRLNYRSRLFQGQGHERSEFSCLYRSVHVSNVLMTFYKVSSRPLTYWHSMFYKGFVFFFIKSPKLYFGYGNLYKVFMKCLQVILNTSD